VSVLEPLHAEREPYRLLSPRELEVLELASLGLTNTQIAMRLSVTIHAIKFHLAAVYRKLGVTNRTEAVVVFLGAASRQAPSGGNGSP
jgi:DNA-binding NarL/FixJ family response regulator